MGKRFLCLFAAFAVLFCVSTPVFATGVTGGVGVGIPVGVNVNLDVVDFFNYCRDDLRYCWNSIRHVVDEDICPYAPQAGGRHEFEAVRTMVNGQIGLYYQCKHCGRNYGDALDEAYQDYVETLPGKSYNSDGAFLWVPGAEDFINPLVTVRTENDNHGLLDSFSLDLASAFPSGSCQYYGSSSSYRISSAVAYVGQSVDFTLSFANAYSWPCYCCVLWGQLRLPVSGFYSVVSGWSRTISFSRVPYSAGQTLAVGDSVYGVLPAGLRDRSCSISWPAFWVAPYTGGSGGNTYELTTRVSGSASDGGLFGYVQDGQLYQSSVGTIYDETTNIYNNPVTGDTSTISSWSYDYSDRSYSLTTDEGDSISVTYGDSSVVINEGGTTYNVLYLVEEPESGVQESTSHTHSYSASVTTPPTCTGTGVRTLTCTECGWQTTEVIPATGHSYSASVVTREPTCTASGLRVGTCTICGDEATEAIPATGHSYSSSVTTAPTCVLTGVRTYTCGGCGDTYTEAVPATGHTWQVVRSVPTEYDDAGQLIQEGYTLYQCLSCGEQYRIDTASGGSSLPAPSSGGVSVSGETDYGIDSSVGRGLLATIAHGLTEDLPEALRAASEMFTVLPAFYAGFTSFLKDGVAGCMPDVPRLMMGFGMGMVTVIGILRKIFGR